MSEVHIDLTQKGTPSTLNLCPKIGNLYSRDSDSDKYYDSGTPEEDSGSDSPSGKAVFSSDYLCRLVDHTGKRIFESDSDENGLESEKMILNTFLNEVRKVKPAPLRNWSALQHFIYYIYRHVLSGKRYHGNEVFSNLIVKKIRELVEGLVQEDLTQLCVRLVTLLREYSLVAKLHFDRLRFPNASAYLSSLVTSYNAFCTAATKLSPLLAEFDSIVMEKFNVNWLCLNKSIYYHYVYKSPSVTSKLQLFLKLKERNKLSHKNLLESFDTLQNDMSFVSSHWITIRAQVSKLSHEKAVANPTSQLISDWYMFHEQKKIMKTNYWMIRSAEAMQLQNMSELDGHILSLVGDRSYVADVLVDSLGNCLCEDCLSAEFRTNVLPPPYDENAPEPYHLIGCYICHEPVILQKLTSHIMAKHQESPSPKPTRVYLTPHQKRLFSPKKASKAPESPQEVAPTEEVSETKTVLRDSILKIINSKQSTNAAASDQIRIDDVRETNLDNNKILNKSTDTFAPEGEELKHKTPRVLCDSKVIQPTQNVSAKIEEKVFKVACEAPVMKTNNEVLQSAFKTNELQSKCEHATNSISPVKNIVTDTFKCVVTDQKIKKTEFVKSSFELPKDGTQKLTETGGPSPEQLTPNSTDLAPKVTTESAFRKPQQKNLSNLDSKMLEIFKNANSQKSTAPKRPSGDGATCSATICGHQCKQESETVVNKCKQEVEKFIESKKHSCPDTCDYCDYHKESRKCDCAFCEVFGSSLPTHTHKTNETRDRLRTRLNQRKEKDGSSKITSKTTTGTNAKLNSKTEAVNGSSKLTNNSKAVISTKAEIDSRGPPRVPEVVHVVPPASNKKSTLTSVEAKKLQTLNSRESSGAQKSILRTTPVVSDADRNGNDCPVRRSLSSLSVSSLNSDNIGSRDINELLNYIEGNKKIDKAALAQKKADKKARQRLKKAQIRERNEKENQLKEEARLREEKLKEEERLKVELLAKQLAEKQKKLKKGQDEQTQENQESRKNKKKNKNASTTVEKVENAPKLIEETIPAMVTIKRVAEGSDTPATVTITLKGSTPESDKLLFTLVNGYNNKEHVATATINDDGSKSSNKNKNDTSVKEQVSNKKDKETQAKNVKKKKGKETPKLISQNVTKELRVTIALDKNNSKKESVGKKNSKSNETTRTSDSKVIKASKDLSNKKANSPKPAVTNPKPDLNIPMLRLPPGITITKIEGPPTNRNCKNSNSTLPSTSQSSNVPVSKSGVIVVDTEKLIQQSITATNNKKNKKKNKKKRDAKQPEICESASNKGNMHTPESSMVTLKNPIFHTLQSALCNKGTDNNDLSVYPNNQQASIFKNENGMVTIRSPRLQNNYDSGSPISNFITDLKPMFGPEVPSPYVPICQANFSENKSFNAQEILSGLPGIEITKVDKNSARHDIENKRSSQPAEVSIIPTNNGVNGTDKFNLDRDDWPFESVFTPRDVLEEDMDAEERELEAFKRFCQQSVPPKQKEKVAHLNVKDIVLKKKTDVTYA